MKKLLLITILTTTLFSCIEVKFKDTQPTKTKSLTEFPIELQGKYLISLKDTINENDTFTIAKNYFSEFSIEKSVNKGKKKNIFLSDSLVLKKINNNYTINIREDEFWMVILLKPINDVDYSVLFIDGDDEATVEQLNLITKVEKIKDEDGEIKALILNPKKKAFLKMVENKLVFKELYQLQKIKN